METLMNRLENAHSPFHVVTQCEEELITQGYRKLQMEELWNLEDGKSYFINHHGSTLIMFTLPSEKHKLIVNHERNTSGKPAIRICCAHTDYPCLRIKANADIITESYHKLNAEVYGGAILNTWLDRPLGIAGKIAVTGEQAFCPRLLAWDSKKALMTIPNVAIHMNREVNKGIELNKQTDMIPLFALDEEESFDSYLARELQIDENDLLDYELTAFISESPAFIGAKKEMISSPRIDNVSSIDAIMDAFLKVKQLDALNMGVLFDHEEIGSRSKQGAQSSLLTDVIIKIYHSVGLNYQQAKDAIYQGMMLSVDVAHALHPNHPEKEDVTNKPVLNGGFCIKEASAQSYATDCEGIAIVEQLARKRNISYQKFVNRSDIPGGGTLGALSSALLPMKTVDIGIPILAMHSARETMGVKDLETLRNIVTAFYEE